MFRISIFIFILTSICFSQQSSNIKQTSSIDGENIVRKAREAAGISAPVSSLRIKLFKSLQIKADEKGAGRTSDSEDETTILFTDKIRLVSVNKGNSLSFIITTIWNESKYSQTMESEIFGERRVTNTTESLSTERLNNVLGKTKLKKADISQTDKKVIFSNELWTSVFPLIFISPIESRTKLEFIGRAQAGQQTANLVETKSPNGDPIQLFFDEKTNILLLMIAKGKNPFGDYEDRYYFSNREKKDNVLIPTKIKVERKFTPTGKTSEVSYQYIDIKSFEVNPPIKADLFKIN